MSPQLAEITVDYNKSVSLLEKGSYKKAEQLLDKCLKKYEFKEGLTNLGNVYKFTGRDRAMFNAYNRALDPRIPTLAPYDDNEYHPALNNLGLAYYLYGDDAKAIEYYDRAISKKPDFYDALWNKSTALLRRACSGRVEDFALGWQLYDARFKKNPPVKLKNNKPDLVWWDFKSEYSEILVLAEQGIGDNLMFARYLSLLHDVTVQCDPSLEEFFRFAGYKTVQNPYDCAATVALPMCSLARLSSEIPSGDWLRGYGDVYEFDKEKFNIGIVWAGNSSHANDKYRSVNVHRFHSLSRYAKLYSLSPGFKGDKHVSPLDIKSWDDTAKYINGLDLVITIDSSVAHFCGSIGKECWVLMPMKETDFRWGSSGSTNMWYSSVTVFRNPNDWDFVFSQVSTALEDKYL